MKKNLFLFTAIITGNYLNAQTGNIKFTAVKNIAQENQIVIRAKNISASAISGVLGSSNITLSLAFPSTLSGLDIQITSPITGQEFELPLRSKFGTDSIYSWNGKGATSAVSFPANTNVDIAAVTFNGGAAGATSTVKIVCLAASGPSGFDYCYIAPGGTEQSGYSSPFFSDIAADPLLQNCGGPNDVSAMCTSTLGISQVLLPVKFLSFYALKSGDNAKLSWTVSSDEENKYFDVERSTNGRGFTSFARVNAYENGQSTNTYEAADMLISKNGSKDLYYRIKQTDKSGAAIYSVVRNLNIYQSSLGISLYPNPARSVSRLMVDAPAPSKAIVTLRDFTGKQLQVMNLQFIKGINQKDINVSNLPAGDYNVSVVSENLNQTIKLSKLK